MGDFEERLSGRLCGGGYCSRYDYLWRFCKNPAWYLSLIHISIVYEYIQAQSKVEQDPQTGIDAAAEPTAVMLRKVLMPVAGGDQIREAIFLQLGYFLGRWIYLIDAADDIEKDQKKNNFNPFVKKLIREREKPLEGEALADYCNGVLNQTLSQIILSYQLLSLRHFDTVISNILTQGLPAMQKLVLYDRKAKREKV